MRVCRFRHARTAGNALIIQACNPTSSGVIDSGVGPYAQLGVFYAPRLRRKTQMIKFLASIFRGLSFIFGINAPPPEEDQRPFVFMWLGIIVFVLAFSVFLFYVLSREHIR